MINLDLSLLPEIVAHRVFKGIPHFVERDLVGLPLPQTIDRLRGAGWFLDEMSADNDLWLNRACLRAGLSEFRSVNQALHWDLGRRDVYGPLASRNPLVHLAFRLRRIAVYVANAPTVTREVAATLTLGEESVTSQIKILLIEDLAKYLQREQFKDYQPADLATLCDWFDRNQSEYGAPMVLSVGIYQYCQELSEVYGPGREVPHWGEGKNAG